MCVLGKLRSRNLTTAAELDELWASTWYNKAINECGMKNMMHLPAIMKILKHAFQADKGNLYFDIYARYFRHLSLMGEKTKQASSN
jgi:hypothetical protein